MIILLILFAIIIALSDYLLKFSVYRYWTRRNIKQLPPTFLVGNFGKLALQQLSLSELIRKLYNDTKNEALIGVYMFYQPTLQINDVKIAKNILQTDFKHFEDRGPNVDVERDPLAGNLFMLSGDAWKNMRSDLTPSFTPGKLKVMFPTILQTANKLLEHIDSISHESSIEIRDMSARFVTDIIASVSFGIEVNSIENPNHIFRVMGRKAIDSNLMNGIRIFLNALAPKLNEYIKVNFVNKESSDFMIDVVRKTVEYRDKNNEERKDFLQLLLQMRDASRNVENGKEMSINEMAAQAAIIYFAGFETTSTTMAFCLYELAKNKEIQRKVQLEIDQLLVDEHNEVTFDTLAKLTYLEKCFDETLRKYPPVPMLNRLCTESYTIPELKITIQKGETVYIPVSGFHHDPKFYPNPNEFIPERFDNIDEMKNVPYYPFGEGPRNCIGLRLGKLNAKVGLAFLLSKYNFEFNEKTPAELKPDPKVVNLIPLNGIHLKIIKR
uniref:Putative cytochrome n=1 Tax=Corethrella appendiculata TaxID=1370023 RepID=U5ELR3_9DIPT